MLPICDMIWIYMWYASVRKQNKWHEMITKWRVSHSSRGWPRYFQKNFFLQKSSVSFDYISSLLIIFINNRNRGKRYSLDMGRAVTAIFTSCLWTFRESVAVYISYTHDSPLWDLRYTQSIILSFSCNVSAFLMTFSFFVYTDAVSNRNVFIVSWPGNRIENDTSPASQFRPRPFLNRCGFAVYTTSKRPGSDNELDRRRVNERCNSIETMRLQMKLRPCKQCLSINFLFPKGYLLTVE